MEAGILRCPACGAAASDSAPDCGHCGARLARVACPSCFGMLFEGAIFCPHCGGEARRVPGSGPDLPCPKCESPLVAVQLGETPVRECEKCHGLWVDAATFDRICTDRAQQSAVLGSASPLIRPEARSFQPNVRYVRCPDCQELMHRVNFARCSGVVLDLCRGHGTWLDRDELRQIVLFIRTGGLDLAREKEKSELDETRRRLEAARRSDASREPTSLSPSLAFREGDLLAIAGSLVGRLLGK